MFDLNPLSRPIAVAEMLVLLTLAAFTGWLLARLILTNRINALRSAIVDQEAELDDCRRTKTTPAGSTSKPIAPVPAESVREMAGAPVTDLAAPDLVVPSSAVLDAPLVLGPERPFAEPIDLAAPNPVTPAVAANSESAILQRIAARAGEVNFDRIGLASASEADDLKDIVGIGPFLERKLHSIGIYTFRQVANFTKEDTTKVNEIIEFFPGLIERDNWVDQAKVLYERKYGNQ